MPPRNPLLDALTRRVVVFDGSMGATLQAMNLSAADFGGKEGCNDHLSLTKPDVIGALHRAFLEAGADALETNTFQASRLKLDEYGLGDQTREHNVASARLAREAADEYTKRDPSRPRFVVGSLGPTGMLPSANDPALSRLSYADLFEIYREQADALLEGGVDGLLVETQQDILETRAAITACARAAQAHADATGGERAAVLASVSLDTQGRMLLGTDIAAVCAILEALPCDVAGLNCSTGPEYMRDAMRYLAQHSSKYVSCIPNAGIPRNEGGLAIYPLEPEGMRDHLESFVTDFGVNIIGGCCGSGPEHIRLLAIAAKGKTPRTPKPKPDQEVASAMTALQLAQEPRPLIVGERLNAQGSRKVKRLVLADDYDALVEVAREQVSGGAHALDVCMALTEREGEDSTMAEIVKRLELSVEAPLMIDSTEAKVVRRALETNPGRAIINSINLENGRSRIDEILPLALEHGAAVVALTIEKSIGMAKTPAAKAEVAQMIEAICCGEYGLPRGRLIFDVLTFTLATGQPEYLDAGANTIEGIRAVKTALPGVLTVLGVSNISFGLNPAARAVINSVFLYHCVAAGLDLAIVNPKDITPYALIMGDERELAEDLIFNRRPDALQRVITRYEGVSAATATDGQAEPDDADLPVTERIHRRILHRKKEGIEALLDEALRDQSAVDLLNGCLLGAMKDVGDRFGAGELILPFVLQSAEVMKKAVSYLEQFLEKNDSYTKGIVVLATVFGDVHDIGKNLVHTILSNNGYTVHDLGKQVPLHAIIEKAVEVKADAIGLSALLVSTSKQMPLCLQELHREGHAFPVIVGGAAINRAYVQRIGFVDPETYFQPGVFYAKDAFEGLALMDTLQDPSRREGLRTRVEIEARDAVARRAARTVPAAVDMPARSAVAKDAPIPKPPFWGARELRDIRVPDVFRTLDVRSLYRLQWGAKSAKGDAWRALLHEEFRPRFERMKSEAIETGWLAPRAIFGFFPAASDGDDLILFQPNDPAIELARFSFPRQPAMPRLCISDYFASVDEERRDVVALQAVTVGAEATARYTRLQAAGEYAEALYVHGLAVEAAEGLAELVHRHIRRELGIAAGQGKRYSWGYPACPDIEEHRKFFAIMPCDTIGMTITEAFQLVPEQSTVALVVHHPEATYFSALGAGESVLTASLP
ncbi:MAG TPA: methionine synthase [Candidatus Eremiobacteraceae bacterium]|nr:methionine synthase [Candidatus Eremiobacteraceae bacterium]